jgi:hypothetical protein
MFPITYLAAPWDETKQKFIITLFGGLWVKQNYVIFGIVKLVCAYYFLHLAFGEMGDCQ